MTPWILGNVIICAIVLAVIVGKLVWAIATAHRDRFGLIPIRSSSEVAKGLDLDEDSQPATEVALIWASPRSSPRARATACFPQSVERSGRAQGGRRRDRRILGPETKFTAVSSHSGSHPGLRHAGVAASERHK